MKRIMRAFKIHEISGVDKPAQAHARAAILKRHDMAATKGTSGLRAIGKDSALLKKLGLLKGFGVSKTTLAESLKSIIEDEEVADKGAMIEETIKQFGEAVEDDITKTLAAQHADEPSDEDKMSAALIAKALGLAESASHEEIIAAVAAKDAAVAKATADAEAVAKSARDAELAKAAAEKEELAKRLAILEDERELAQFAKKATEIGLPEGKADVLRKARKGDAASVDEVFEMLKAAHSALEQGEVFKEYGSAQPSSGDEMDALNAKAAELRKANPELTQDQAFARAYSDPANRALAKAERRKNRPAA